MSPVFTPELRVTLALEQGDDAYDTRVIAFEETGGSMQVGRASKTERKQLLAAKDNLWISNPVISREHAVLSAVKDDVVDKLVAYLEDEKSSHGTFVNQRDIKGKGKVKLLDGDKVQFGDHVVRGADKFAPPAYRVSMETVYTDRLFSFPGIGRSYSVPDDDDSESSEMDESDSDARSTHSLESHSSPPHLSEEKNVMPGSSRQNPFSIDDDAQGEVIVIDDEPVREASEDYEPEDVIAETYYEEAPSKQTQSMESESEAETSDDEESDPFIERPESPIYTPNSPAARHHGITHLLSGAPHYPLGFVPPPPQATYPYIQGPFAASARYPFDPVFSALPTMPMPEPNPWSEGQDEGVSGTLEQAEEFDATSRPVYFSPEPVHKFNSLTASTEDFLDAARNHEDRTLANKKNMSIKSLINPPSVAGAKRKADDISDEDEEEPEFELEEEEEVEAEEPQIEVTEVIEPVVEVLPQHKKEKEVVVDVVEVTVKEERPTKRRRTYASHIGAFALGGVATLATLVCLPENYFG